MDKPQIARLLCTGRGIETIYSDGVDYGRLAGPGGTVTVRRNSHVDPLPGPGVRWAIFWLGEFRDRFGDVTLTDDAGRPFHTKQSAVEHELMLLQRSRYS